MNRSYYSASIESFLATSPDAILGELTRASEFSVDQTQAVAWIEQINILKPILQQYARTPQAGASQAEALHPALPFVNAPSARMPQNGVSHAGAPNLDVPGGGAPYLNASETEAPNLDIQEDEAPSGSPSLAEATHSSSSSAGAIYFEYAIPRMGKRIDVLLIINSVLLVLEFKAGEKEYHGYHIDQVWDYALDLKNFHETSHDKVIVPILVATNAKTADLAIPLNLQHDKILNPVRSNASMLGTIIRNLVDCLDDKAPIGVCECEGGCYCPKPTRNDDLIRL